MILPIVSERLTINALDESMAETLHINSLDEDNRRFVPDEVFETTEKAAEIIKWLISAYARDDAPLVYPVLLNNGANIGYVQAVPIKDGWEIGYHIAMPYTGNGYATEAVKAFVRPVMRHIGITELYGICRADNLASRKVLEKSGFVLLFERMEPEHGELRLVRRYVYRSEP